MYVWAAPQVSSKATLPQAEAGSLAPAGSSNSLPNSKGPQLAVVLLLGLDGAGKTTLLGTLQGDRNPKVRPSVGFKPVTMMLSDELKVNDCSGKARGDARRDDACRTTGGAE